MESLDASKIWIFYASLHQTMEVDQFKEDNDILSLPCPDLNPIKHLWDKLEK